MFSIIKSGVRRQVKKVWREVAPLMLFVIYGLRAIVKFIFTGKWESSVGAIFIFDAAIGGYDFSMTEEEALKLTGGLKMADLPENVRIWTDGLDEVSELIATAAILKVTHYERINEGNVLWAENLPGGDARSLVRLSREVATC